MITIFVIMILVLLTIFVIVIVIVIVIFTGIIIGIIIRVIFTEGLGIRMHPTSTSPDTPFKGPQKGGLRWSSAGRAAPGR